MKLKNSYFYTLREDAKDEESISGNLLVRAGMMKKVGAGIYMYLPTGLRVLDKIKRIVKEEMDNAGAEELLMPSLIPQDYYETCDRVHLMGDSMFKLRDRKNAKLVLGPTHEELFTIAAKNAVKSYKDLPFTIYQQADKFRDEPRPRFGLIRVREFIMKDAYSFDKDEDGLDVSYNKMKEAYNKIYNRLGINYKIVKADTGVMGGSLSEEYQAVTDIGEDILVLCDKCDYSSNIEVSECVTNNKVTSFLLVISFILETHFLLNASSPTLNASSIINISGFIFAFIENPSLAFIPLEYVLTGWSIYSPSSANSIIGLSNSLISSSFIPRIWPFKNMFSLLVNSWSNPDVNSSNALTLPLTSIFPSVG